MSQHDGPECPLSESNNGFQGIACLNHTKEAVFSMSCFGRRNMVLWKSLKTKRNRLPTLLRK